MEVYSVKGPGDQSRLVGGGRDQSFKERKMEKEINRDGDKEKTAEEDKDELKKT